MSGYQIAAEVLGDYYTYQLAPRAKIFRRDAGNIETVAQLQKFMMSIHYRIRRLKIV